MTNPLRFGVASALMATALLATTACEEPVVSQMGSPATAGGVEFNVNGYELRFLELETDGDTVEYSEPVLAVEVQATNTDESPITYNPSHRSQQMSEASTPLLYMDPGAEAELPPSSKQTINGVYLEKGRLDEQISESKTLQSGDSITDVFLFEVPDAKEASLILSFPPTMHRGEIPALFRIPYQYEEPKGPTLHQVGDTVALEDVEFLVEKSEVEFVKIEDTVQGEGYSSEPVLKIAYKLTNAGEEPLEYNPSHRDVAGTRGAALYADGQTIKRVRFSATTTPEGQVNDDVELEPGKSVEDVTIFERPEEGVESVTFEYPAGLFGRSGLIRVEIPYEYKDPERPAELEKAENDK